MEPRIHCLLTSVEFFFIRSSVVVVFCSIVTLIFVHMAVPSSAMQNVGTVKIKASEAPRSRSREISVFTALIF